MPYKSREAQLAYWRRYNATEREPSAARYARYKDRPHRTHWERDPAAAREYARLWRQRKRREDPQFRLKERLRTRLNCALRRGTKTGSAVRDLGCTVAELRSHLEALFLPGMTWENMGKWHIDHIKPLASFDLTNREHLLEACHYTNLQPLWAIDNIRKGAREVCHFDSN